jgi:pimeloyl-ACP methyl ester carboxylesterase
MTTFVLIPGAGGAAEYWQLVEPELRRRGYRAISVALPASDDDAGLREYADAVLKAVGDTTDDLVIVGQSLGGFTAPVVAEELNAKLIVLVNAMIPAPGESAGDWWDNTGSGAARRDNDRKLGRDPDEEFDLDFYFLHDLPADVAEMLLSDDRPQSNGVFARPNPLTAWPDIPTRVVVGRDDRFFPADFQQRVAKERLGIEADLIPGGHLVALSRPMEVVDQLEHSLNLLDPSSRTS